ncbi:MAG: hypothetical protein ACKVH0_04555 [Alphaproteobacteria bacterium]
MIERDFNHIKPLATPPSSDEHIWSDQIDVPWLGAEGLKNYGAGGFIVDFNDL